MVYYSRNASYLRVVDLSAAEIAAPTASQLADMDTAYRLNVSPFTLYISNGVSLVAIGSGGSGVGISASGSSQTSGNVVFSNANGVTFGMNGSTVTASANAGGVGISASGSSQTVGNVVFSNSNGVTFGMNGSTVTASVNSAAAAQSATAYAVGNSTQQSSGTVALSAFSVSGAGGVSAGVSGGSIVVSGPALTSLAATGALSASSNGSTISLGVGTVTASIIGNTTQTSSGSVNLNGLVLSGAGGVSMGISAGTVIVSGGAGAAAAAVNLLGANTAGNTTATGSTLGFSGVNMTLSGTNASQVVFSVPATSSLVGAGGLTVSSNGSTITVSASNQTRLIFPQNNLTPISAHGNGSASFQYLPIQWPVSGTRIDALMNWAGASSATTNTMGIALSAYAVIYTRNGASLSSVSSGSTQTTYTYASNSAGQTQLLTAAVRPVSVPVNFAMTPGEYFVGFNMVTTATSIGLSTTNLAQTVSVMGGNLLQTAANYAEFTNQTNASVGLQNGMGVYSAATTGLAAAYSISGINQTGANLSQANIALVLRNA